MVTTQNQSKLFHFHYIRTCARSYKSIQFQLGSKTEMTLCRLGTFHPQLGSRIKVHKSKKAQDKLRKQDSETPRIRRERETYDRVDGVNKEHDVNRCNYLQNRFEIYNLL